MKISEKKQKEIKAFLEIYECKTNGKWNLNGGYANVDNMEIVEMNDSYIIKADVEIGDYFDEEHPQHEEFYDVWWVIDRGDFHILTKEELKERDLENYEDIFMEM